MNHRFEVVVVPGRPRRGFVVISEGAAEIRVNVSKIIDDLEDKTQNPREANRMRRELGLLPEQTGWYQDGRIALLEQELRARGGGVKEWNHKKATGY